MSKNRRASGSNTDDREVFSGESLPRREKEVLQQIWLGLSNPEIALCLGIKVSTVKTYVRRLYAHVGVANRIQLLQQTGYLSDEKPGVSTPPEKL